MGKLARYSIGGGPGFTRKATVELQINAAATTSYHLEFGATDADDRQQIQWFEDLEYVFPDTDSVELAWEQAFRYVRIMIDTAAPADSEARVAVCYGR